MASPLAGNMCIAEQMLMFPTNSFGTINLSSLNYKVAAIIRIPTSGTIDGFVFRTSNHSSNGTLTGGVYTVDSSGNPTTTAYGGMATGTVSVTANNTYTCTFGTPATAVAGDLVAFVLDLTSAGSFRVVTTLSTFVHAFPYGSYYTTSWAKQLQNVPCFALKYASNQYTYVSGMFAGYTGNTPTVSTSTSPSEVGNRFQIPATGTLYGAIVIVNPSNTSAAFDVVLYDSGGTLITSKSVDANKCGGTGGYGSFCIMFDSVQSITKLTNYFLMVKPTSTNSINLRTLVYLNSDVLNQSLGTNKMIRANVTSGVFSTVSDEQSFVIPVFSVITGGGGGVPFPLFYV